MTYPGGTHIGRSPAGVTWVAWRPEHVETMRKRLALLWERHARRAPQPGERCVYEDHGVRVSGVVVKLGTPTDGWRGRAIYLRLDKPRRGSVDKLGRPFNVLLHRAGRLVYAQETRI